MANGTKADVISSGNHRMFTRTVGNLNFQLFALSAWMLFLELFLIRWVSTEIRIFAYVNNSVLLACFIGMGLGCYFAERRQGSEDKDSGLGNIVPAYLFLTALVVAVKSGMFVGITDLLSDFIDSIIWSQNVNPQGGLHILKALHGILLTIFIFGLTAAVFFYPGQSLGRMFNRHPRIISAYSWNVLGSIAGIWLFGILSFCYAPPWVPLALLGLTGLYFVKRKWRCLFFAFICFTASSAAMLIPEPGLFTCWSPYQKLTVKKNFVGNIQNGYGVMVNNVGFMGLLNMSRDFVNAHYDVMLRSISRINQYEIPYEIKTNAKEVLIVGSGGGNDVAGALRSGIPSIDAVEIDPGVRMIGKRLHPEHPYQDPRVHAYTDDARSFFKKSHKSYDVISFGLLDSHVVPSQYNNVRLDHYVYTLESFEEARKLLKPDGIMTVIFATPRSWVAARIYQLLKETFKNEPVVFSLRTPGWVFGWGGTMYIAGSDRSELLNNLKKNKLLEAYIRLNGIDNSFLNSIKGKITTDDWPYLYLQKPSIPGMYMCILLSLAALFFFAKKALFRGSARLDRHFFCLGAAFMLLEFQNISKASLLFGATWLVNAYMITAILVLILLANYFVHRFKITSVAWYYCFLWGSVLCLYFIPLTDLNIASYWLKSTLIAVFMNIPIFFAGVIFIRSFQDCTKKSLALGSNLLGACFGGLLESVSFITGVKAVLILVLLLYGAAYLFRTRSAQPLSPPAYGGSASGGKSFIGDEPKA